MLDAVSANKLQILADSWQAAITDLRDEAEEPGTGGELRLRIQWKIDGIEECLSDLKAILDSTK